MRLALTLTYFKRWDGRTKIYSLYEVPEKPLSGEEITQEIQKHLETILENRRIEQGKVTITITAGE